MAVNRRYRVFGRWYGQAWADSEMETWASLGDAMRSLVMRENMNQCFSSTAQELSDDSGFYRIGESEYSAYYADSNEFRHIDLYYAESYYDSALDSWVWSVDDSIIWKRLTFGPRGGVVVENG